MVDSATTSVSIRDWVDWLAVAFTVGGAFVTIIAFWFTFREAREARLRAGEARNSADAARHAADDAVEAIAVRQSISDLGRISAGLREIQVAMRGCRYEAALIQLQALRSQLHRLRSRSDFASEERRLLLQEMVVSWRGIQEVLEAKLEDGETEISTAATNNILAKHIAQLDEWSEEVAYPQRRKSDEA